MRGRYLQALLIVFAIGAADCEHPVEQRRCTFEALRAWGEAYFGNRQRLVVPVDYEIPKARRVGSFVPYASVGAQLDGGVLDVATWGEIAVGEPETSLTEILTQADQTKHINRVLGREVCGPDCKTRLQIAISSNTPTETVKRLVADLASSELQTIVLLLRRPTDPGDVGEFAKKRFDFDSEAGWYANNRMAAKHFAVCGFEIPSKSGSHAVFKEMVACSERKGCLWDPEELKKLALAAWGPETTSFSYPPGVLLEHLEACEGSVWVECLKSGDFT